MSNHFDALVAPTGYTMQSAHTVEVVCSWHDGSTKSENVLTKSFMLCHLLTLTSVIWLAKQALDLSFYVVACHNHRRVLNNYFEPWCKATLRPRSVQQNTSIFNTDTTIKLFNITGKRSLRIGLTEKDTRQTRD